MKTFSELVPGDVLYTLKHSEFKIELIPITVLENRRSVLRHEEVYRLNYQMPDGRDRLIRIVGTNSISQNRVFFIDAKDAQPDMEEFYRERMKELVESLNTVVKNRKELYEKDI